jgi:hypothetical protein
MRSLLKKFAVLATVAIATACIDIGDTGGNNGGNNDGPGGKISDNWIDFAGFDSFTISSALYDVMPWTTEYASGYVYNIALSATKVSSATSVETIAFGIRFNTPDEYPKGWTLPISGFFGENIEGGVVEDWEWGDEYATVFITHATASGNPVIYSGKSGTFTVTRTGDTWSLKITNGEVVETQFDLNTDTGAIAVGRPRGLNVSWLGEIKMQM